MEEATISDNVPLYRIIDANLNRLKEGIRVIEYINRYLFNDETVSTSLKELRHLCIVDDYKSIVEQRDSIGDVFKDISPLEMDRADIGSVAIANFKRSQESSRVLEEVYKVVEPNMCENFKKIRFKLYTLEKETLFRFK